jgi:hypothetical protein
MYTDGICVRYLFHHEQLFEDNQLQKQEMKVWNQNHI